MQFKHPELLYALFLLLIPIIIHLFQLRRFQKVAFTNVAFLKKVNLQTRKSSQLKKWITLLIRLLALACIIIAFAQPFSASKTALNTKKETVIYIDNSFSMQAKGAEGPMLQRALQQLYSQALPAGNLSWFTNDYSKKNARVQDFKDALLSTEYTQKQLPLSDVLLKANQLFSKTNLATEKTVIILSDFQEKGIFPKINKDIKVDVVQLKPTKTSNISIDTAYIKKTPTTTKLIVKISAQGESKENIPVSLYNNNSLVSKVAINFSEKPENNNTTLITFDINNTAGFTGKLILNDPSLLFDNTLYFNINKPKKIKVLSLNNARSGYLQRIFNQDEFEYTQQNSESLNYSAFLDQDLLILNELITIPASLITALQSFIKNDGSVFIIPSKKADLNSYNSLFAKLQVGSFAALNEQEKMITQIVFDHPLYNNVFEKQIVNFQYPKVQSYYPMSTQASTVLRFEDNKPFVIQHNNVYVSTAPINTDNSNFKNSPLIVPTLYNIAKHSFALPKLYYEVGKQNNFSVNVKLMQDEILKITDSTTSLIPLQQTKATKVNITTQNKPSKAGVYAINKEKEIIEHLSYNYTRNESLLRYANPKNWEDVKTYNTINELFNAIAKENTINSYWKWFVIFAFLFLLLEMMILKFYK